jgi:hypothetical protein
VAVKLPGDEGAGGAEYGGAGYGGAGAGGAEYAGAAGGAEYGAATGGAGYAGAAGGCSVSVPNSCVKLPGDDGAAGGGGGAALENVAADAGPELNCGGGSGLVSDAPCLSSDASKSSSARGGAPETVPNIPVALEELPPADSFVPGESGLSKGDLGASIRGPPCSKIIPLFRIPRLHRLGLTVKGRQPTMQTNFAASRSAHSK